MHIKVIKESQKHAINSCLQLCFALNALMNMHNLTCTYRKGRVISPGKKYFHFNNKVSKAQRYTPIVPALGRLRHKDIEFKALLGYITRLCLSKQHKTKVTLLRWGLPLSFYFTVSLFNFAYLSKPLTPTAALLFFKWFLFTVSSLSVPVSKRPL